MKRETMTSRERVLKSLNHQPVDRVPIDLGMHNSTGISAFAYWNLLEHLGLSTDNIEIVDMVQFLPRVSEQILKRFHCDCIMLQSPFEGAHPWSPWGKYTFNIPGTAKPPMDERGNWNVSYNGNMRMPKNGFFFDGDWLNMESRSEDDLIEATAKEAERIFKDTDYFTAVRGFGGFFSEADIEWQCSMITDPEKIIEENEIALENALRKAGKIIDSMGDYVQGFCIGADLGSQTGPLCRPSLYEELCAPYLKKLCSFVHQNSDFKIFYHCCGSIKQFIPILIDCGVDVLNPVQISASDMEPEVLKKEFGGKIAFWGGGCDTQRVLAIGSKEEIRDNVKMLMDIFKQNTGYVFNQVHNIMGDVPPENIITMFDAAYENSFF